MSHSHSTGAPGKPLQIRCTHKGESALSDGSVRRIDVSDLLKRRELLPDLKVVWNAYKYRKGTWKPRNHFACTACANLHGRVFTIEEAARIEISGNCRCTLLPYREVWEQRRGEAT